MTMSGLVVADCTNRDADELMNRKQRKTQIWWVWSEELDEADDINYQKHERFGNEPTRSPVDVTTYCMFPDRIKQITLIQCS